MPGKPKPPVSSYGTFGAELTPAGSQQPVAEAKSRALDPLTEFKLKVVAKLGDYCAHPEESYYRAGVEFSQDFSNAKQEIAEKYLGIILNHANSIQDCRAFLSQAAAAISDAREKESAKLSNTAQPLSHNAGGAHGAFTEADLRGAQYAPPGRVPSSGKLEEVLAGLAKKSKEEKYKKVAAVEEKSESRPVYDKTLTSIKILAIESIQDYIGRNALVKGVTGLFGKTELQRDRRDLAYQTLKEIVNAKTQQELVSAVMKAQAANSEFTRKASLALEKGKTIGGGELQEKLDAMVTIFDSKGLLPPAPTTTPQAESAAATIRKKTG
jgi:hypothetical protein